MTTSSEKPKKSPWGQEQWLPHAGLAAVGAIAVAVFAVLAGWWGGLSRILIKELTPQLLLDTAGVLFLVILVLSYSLYRKIKVSKIVNMPIPTPAIPPKVEVRRLPELQEKILIHAANYHVTAKTLVEIAKIHPEEAKFHFDTLRKFQFLSGDPSCSMLNHSGRAYLLTHGLMPDASTVPSASNQRRRIPGSGMPPATFS